MTIKEFSEEQQHALLDLVTLAMYADGHLATAEDARIRRLLTTIGITDDSARNTTYDGAVARIRPHLHNEKNARSHATALAQAFSTAPQRQLVLQTLDDVVNSDNNVTTEEQTLLAAVREALQK